MTLSQEGLPALCLGPHLNLASRSSYFYLKFYCLVTVYNFIIYFSKENKQSYHLPGILPCIW